MKRSLLSSVFAAALFVPALAGAATGVTVISLEVAPKDAPKLVAAYDKYYASDAAKGFKGRTILSSNVADGADPATHSLWVQFRSAAEQETYMNAVAEMPARKELMDSLGSLAKVTYTGRAALVRSWGDAADDDIVWVTYDVNVSDVAAFNAALDAWMASPKGKSFPGQGQLWAITFGGADAPTHAITLGYKSLAEADAWTASLPGDPDFVKFQGVLAKVTVRVGAYLNRVVKTWGASEKSLLAP